MLHVKRNGRGPSDTSLAAGMAKCFIHVGMEKTGSTSIQQAIRQNLPWLKEAGIIYPQGGIARLNHNFLASSYLPQGSDRLVRGLPPRIRKGEEKRFLDAYRQDLMSEIRRGHHVIISGEHLFRLRADEISMLKRDLADAGVDDVLIFAVLRSPASFYLSFVQQEVKGSSRFPAPADFFVDYASRVAGWQRHFPCTFLEFSALSASEEGIVGKFAQEMGRFMGVDLSFFRHNIPFVNDSLSPEEMQIVQDFRFRWYSKQDGKLNRPTTRLIKALCKARDKGWRKPILRPEACALIAERHKGEVASLSALTGITFEIPSTHHEHPRKHPLLVREVVANFDCTLYDRLNQQVGSLRHADFGTQLEYLAKRLGLRRQE